MPFAQTLFFYTRVIVSRHLGDVFPVLPRVAKYVPNLFTLNERIVLSGRWQHGFFSVTPVGAYNVGSIKLSTLIDPVSVGVFDAVSICHMIYIVSESLPGKPGHISYSLYILWSRSTASIFNNDLQPAGTPIWCSNK